MKKVKQVVVFEAVDGELFRSEKEVIRYEMTCDYYKWLDTKLQETGCKREDAASVVGKHLMDLARVLEPHMERMKKGRRQSQ